MRRAIVHIGTPRTGTTSLQHILTRLRPALGEAGILYPDLTPASAAAPHLSHQHLGEALDGRRPPRERAELLRRLAAGLRDTPCDVVLLSYEGLCGAPPALNVARTLAALFAAHGFAMETLVTVKPQSEYLNSLYTWRTQFLREGRAFSKFAAAWMGTARLDLARMAAPWQAASDGRLHVVPVRDRQSEAPLAERTLAEVGLLDRVAPLLTAADATLAENRSPGPAAVEVLRRLYQGGGRRMLGPRAREASRHVEAHSLDRAAFRGITPALHAQAITRWQVSNDALALQAWGAAWTNRVAQQPPPPVNEVAAQPLDPVLEAQLAAILDDTCAHFGLRLRQGWAARAHGAADAAAALAGTAWRRGRAAWGMAGGGG